jgi:biopolymer transport protein ExbB/TolQ
MFAHYFTQGGPVMYALLVVWILVLASVLDRVLYGLTNPASRISRSWQKSGGSIDRQELLDAVEHEMNRAAHGVQRIDSLAQLATSLGLFGTVLGISVSFFARSDELGLAAADVLASGLATALFTTVAGLVIFLFGQAFLVIYQEWLSARSRRLVAIVENIHKNRLQADGQL